MHHRSVRLLTAALPLFAAAFAPSCSCDDATDDTSATSQGTASGGAGSTGSFSTTTGSACPEGSPCQDGVCIGGACCATASICAAACCGAGDVCSFASCATPGATCDEDDDCAAGEFCDFSIGEPQGAGGAGGAGGACPGGVEPPVGKCLPRPPVCADGVEPGDPPSCVAKCEYRPPPGVFEPEVKFSWGDPTNPAHNVMMSPIVIQLDDDNCDGTVDQRDIPEIVFFTFDGADYNNGSLTSSTLHAISIVNGQVIEKLTISTDGASADAPGRQIAAANIDADPEPEIVTCTVDNRLRAYEPDGSEKWLSDPAPGICFMPSIADLDQDGAPEVIDARFVLDGATGTVEATLPGEYVVVSDVTGDGLLDIVGSRRVYDAAGNVVVDSGLVGTHPAVGDLDRDGIPEIVSVNFQTHSVNVWHVDPAAPGGFTVVRQGLDINEGIATNKCCDLSPTSAGCTQGGGPPTIARFGEDEFPDVAFASGIGYVVYDGAKLMDPAVTDDQVRLWLQDNTRDCSSAQTGSSVFDFDGDGVAEVVYADETQLHVYDGPTGEELFAACNTSGTLWEYPVVADVDNDGQADIVIASNAYSSITCADGSKTTGVRVLGDSLGKWVRTRRIWNEHAYHVTNVAEDGSIPAAEPVNWLDPKLNNFRQNVQPAGQFAAPDLVVRAICDTSGALRARVQNIGEAPVPAGVVVGFYGSPSATPLGQTTTTKPLYPLSYEEVVLVPATPPGESVYAVVDDGMPAHAWHECRTDNNQSEPVSLNCVPQ